MKFKATLRKEVKVAAALLAVMALIAFSERQHRHVTCRNMIVRIDNIEDNHFIDEGQVMDLVSGTGSSVIGNSISRLNLRALENRLKTDPHIADAQLFGDLTGNLVVNVTLRRPIARIVQPDGPGAYIAEDGSVMYTSDKFSSRVMLLSGEYVEHFTALKSIRETEDGRELLGFIHHIHADRFWRAQIAQLDIDARGRIHIYPQVTGQLVEFGTVNNYEEKLKKLLIFYKEILPQRGWTRYDRVNVEYEGQVIAE